MTDALASFHDFIDGLERQLSNPRTSASSSADQQRIQQDQIEIAANNARIAANQRRIRGLDAISASTADQEQATNDTLQSRVRNGIEPLVQGNLPSQQAARAAQTANPTLTPGTIRPRMRDAVQAGIAGRAHADLPPIIRFPVQAVTPLVDPVTPGNIGTTAQGVALGARRVNAATGQAVDQVTDGIAPAPGALDNLGQLFAMRGVIGGSSRAPAPVNIAQSIHDAQTQGGRVLGQAGSAMAQAARDFQARHPQDNALPAHPSSQNYANRAAALTRDATDEVGHGIANFIHANDPWSGYELDARTRDAAVEAGNQPAAAQASLHSLGNSAMVAQNLIGVPGLIRNAAGAVGERALAARAAIGDIGVRTAPEAEAAAPGVLRAAVAPNQRPAPALQGQVRPSPARTYAAGPIDVPFAPAPSPAGAIRARRVDERVAQETAPITLSPEAMAATGGDTLNPDAALRASIRRAPPRRGPTISNEEPPQRPPGTIRAPAVEPTSISAPNEDVRYQGFGSRPTADGAGLPGQVLDWLGNDRLIRNPNDEQLAGLAQLGDELKYVSDTQGNRYVFSASDAHHNNAMRALHDHGVQVESLGSGADVTNPNAAGFIFRQPDGSFAHQDANLNGTGSWANFARRANASPDAGGGAGEPEWTDAGWRGMTQPLEGDQFTEAPSGRMGPGVYITSKEHVAHVHGDHVYPVQVRGRIATDFASAARERGDAGYRLGHDIVIFDKNNVRRTPPAPPDGGASAGGQQFANAADHYRYARSWADEAAANVPEARRNPNAAGDIAANMIASHGREEALSRIRAITSMRDFKSRPDANMWRGVRQVLESEPPRPTGAPPTQGEGSPGSSPNGGPPPARPPVNSRRIRGSDGAAAAVIGAGGLLASAASGDPSQAQERPPVSAASDEVRQLEGNAQRFAPGHLDRSNRAAVRGAQEFLQSQGLYLTDDAGRHVVPDGIWGSGMTNAVRAYLAHNDAQLTAARARLVEAEHQEASRATRAGPVVEALREFGPYAGYAIGGIIGHSGVPGLRGFGGRVGAVERASAQLAERNAQADALLTSGPLTPGRSTASGALRRQANINDFWRQGGAGENVPFRPAQTQRGFTNRPGAAPASTLFPPGTLRLRSNDVGAIAAGGGEAAFSSVMLINAQQELNSAQVAANQDPSEANLARLENARNMIAILTTTQRLGIGYAGGRLIGSRTHPYVQARPNIAAAEHERTMIGQSLARPRRK